MSIPLLCANCYEVVGVSDGPFAGLAPGDLINSDACPGKGMHPSPVRTIEQKSFKLVQRVTVTYPETSTSSSWNEYVGPRRSFFVWLAIMLGNDRGIVINGKWCWWNFRGGFYGEGVKEFQSA